VRGDSRNSGFSTTANIFVVWSENSDCCSLFVNTMEQIYEPLD